MKKFYMITNLLQKNVIAGMQIEDLGYDSDLHSDYVDKGFNYIDNGVIDIDKVIQNLQQLKEQGTNFVEFYFNGDMNELEITGFSIREMTETESNEYEINNNKIKKENKTLLIKSLEEQLKKLKSE